MFKKWRTLSEFMEGNKALYFGAVISTGISTALTLVAPLVISFAIDFAVGGAAIPGPTWWVSVTDRFGGRERLVQNLWICALLLVLINTVNGIFLFTKGKWSAEASESIAKNIREKIYHKLQSMSYDYHVKAESGDLVQRSTSDVETIRRFLSMQLVEMGRAIFLLIFALFVMFRINAVLAWSSMAVMPVIFVFSMVFFTRIKDQFQLADEAEGRLSNTLQENLTGVRVVRAFGREAYETEAFDKISGGFRALNEKLVRILAVYWSSSDLMIILQIGAILVLGVVKAIAGEITLGNLTVFITYEGMLLWPVRQLGRILADMGKAQVALERIGEILHSPAEDMREEGLTPEIDGHIIFSGVSFDYGDGRSILKDISFEVMPGQTVAILGPTGAGKSSLVHLLQGLYDYKEGSITIDGVELKTIDKRWLRRHVGIVLQEPFLYSKTIRQNIAFPKDGAAEEEIFEAARIASLDDVIREFDKGYETLVGERGVTLSGGQKQRLAIAREMVKGSKVLIFDDSLSAVDANTDERIREALGVRNKNLTTLIISHRINTLAGADLILVLENGRLVQKGSHEELIAMPGLYKRIWEIQSSSEVEEANIV